MKNKELGNKADIIDQIEALNEQISQKEIELNECNKKSQSNQPTDIPTNTTVCGEGKVFDEFAGQCIDNTELPGTETGTGTETKPGFPEPTFPSEPTKPTKPTKPTNTTSCGEGKVFDELSEECLTTNPLLTTNANTSDLLTTPNTSCLEETTFDQSIHQCIE